ncbi:MAG: hypothetical protein KGZ75_07900 [Syntrophomonadaceae bacterium]|nr:hypothetical protein [Syntrophomonadaceae bacterium]
MPDFVSQLVGFFRTALTWVVALAIPAVALTSGYHALMRSMAQDEMAAMHHARSLKGTLIYGVIVILAGGIVSAILGAFVVR